MKEKIFVLYKITNKLNGRYYIGKSFKERVEKGYCGSGPLIRSAVKKYGKENFLVEILNESTNEAEIFELESKTVTEESCFPFNPLSYNLQPGGIGGVEGRKYLIRGDECRVVLPHEDCSSYLQEGWKFGNRHLGKQLSEETKQRISDARKGFCWTEEQKLKMSLQRKGHKPYTAGTKLINDGIVQKRVKEEEVSTYLEKGWNLGTLSIFRGKAAEKNRGQKRSEETREKLRKAWERRKLIPVSEETRKKHSLARKGKSLDLETCNKIRKSKLGKIKVWKEGKAKYCTPDQLDSTMQEGYFKTKKESLDYGRK